MDQVIIELLGTIVTVVVSIATLAYWLGRRFAEIDGRFRQIDDRFKEVNERIDGVEKRLSERINEVNARVSRLADNVAMAMFNTQAFLIDYMGVKGLFAPSEVDLLKNEIARVANSIRANPISKEDLEFIKSVFNKKLEDITIEELEEVEKIAKRWFMEDGDERAIKIFQGAAVIKAYKKYIESQNNPQT